MTTQSIIENKIVPHDALTFDDVLLLPNYSSDIKRADVDLTSKLHERLVLRLPIISSPMDTVTESSMATTLAQLGGLGIIHRNMTIEDQASMVEIVKKTQVFDSTKASVDATGKLVVGAAVGVGADLSDRVNALVKVRVDVLVVDSAHGYSKWVIESVELIKKAYPNAVIMAGNIATFDGAQALVKAGADILRVGMGPGSIYTTRIIAGMGVPQLSALSAVVRGAANSNVTVVADGGIRQIGDMAKALAFGATSVMLGSLLAQFEEAPGDVVEVNGKKYKKYRGMGSVAAMKKGGAERYGQKRDTEAKKLIAEGIEALVEYKGSVDDYVGQIEGSLRSSFYYLGSRNITEFFEKSRVIKISNAGLQESHPHSVVTENTGSNYSIK